MHNTQYKYRSFKHPIISKYQDGGALDLFGASHDTKQLMKFLQSEFGQQLTGNITGIFGNINGAIRNFTPKQSAINSLAHTGLSYAGPVGAIISAGSSVIDTIGGALGAKLDVVDSAAARKAGVSGANKTNEILGSLPLISTIAGAFGHRTIESNKSSEIDEMSSAYGGSVSNIDAAQKLSRKKMLSGLGKANRFINEANRQNRLVTDISTEAKRAKQNSAGETILNQNMNLYSGYSPKLLLSKKGMKFPELEEARNIIKSLSPKSTNTQELQKFQIGGKMNTIPNGSRHSRKHNLEKVNPELEGQITKKGIPVISKDENGDIIQCAEIEKDEWTLRKEFTNKIESLYKQYTENPSDEIAIEAGKLICFELLKNTDDRSGLIKSIK